MNIFEALSQGKGRINEENTSSFLAYLLKDNESHGLRREFLKRFLKRADLGIDDIDDYNVSVKLEYNINNKRILDILITLMDTEENTIKYVIGIENKLSPQSCQNQQLLEEFIGLKNIADYKEAEIFMVFLVPDKEDKQIVREYEQAKKETSSVFLLLWQNVVDEIKSM